MLMKFAYAFLIFSDLAERDRSRFELVRLLDTRDERGGLSGNLLSCELLPRDLLSSGFPCGLLCSSHDVK